jgi:hypothetical protein
MRRTWRDGGAAGGRHWTDVIANASLSDTFKQRTGVDPYRDQRVQNAADPAFNPVCQAQPAPPRRRGHPTHHDFNACVVATTDLVAEFQGKPRRHDWQTITIGMILPGGWGRRGMRGARLERGPDGSFRRDVEDLRDRIKDAYYRERARRRAARIKPRRRRIRPRRARIKPPASR